MIGFKLLDSRNKKTSKQVRVQGGKTSAKILIGDTFKGSNLQVNLAKSRTEAAKPLGRVHKSGDKKRMLPSIVALDYHSQYSLHFSCSMAMIIAARVHCLLCGSPQDGLKFNTQAVSPKKPINFINLSKQENISRALS